MGGRLKRGAREEDNGRQEQERKTTEDKSKRGRQRKEEQERKTTHMRSESFSLARSGATSISFATGGGIYNPAFHSNLSY